MSSYTWEDVIFGIDVRNEQARKADQAEKAEEMREKEKDAAGWWKLGLSLLGGAVFGPAGYLAGKQVGEYGTDWGLLPWTQDFADWESMEMEEGKFDVAAAQKFNKDLKKAADDQTGGQILNTVMDIGKAYVQAGGLTAKPGELDWTTFGSGEGEWTVFGKNQPGKYSFDTGGIPGLEGSPRGPSTFIPGKSVPGLWDKDATLLSNIGSVIGKGTGLYTEDQSGSVVKQLAQGFYEGKKDKKTDKKTGKTFGRFSG